MSPARALPAALIAPAARAWLARARPARVLNVFDRALNLIDDSGGVLSVVAHERGMTPFGLALVPATARPFRDVTTLSPVHVHNHELSVGDVRIDLSQAQPWNPQPDWAVVRATIAANPERLEGLAASALSLGHPAQAVRQMEFALGSLPPSATSATTSAASPPPASLLELYASPTPSALPPALHMRVLSGAADLVSGLLDNDEARAVHGAGQLAGAGGGLTPAGDDFAVGVFLAACAGLYGSGGAELCAPIATHMAPRTTSLSAAYLHAAARGECAAPWHALFAALTEPAAEARRRALANAVDALFAVGHTSGADGLAGFLAYNQSIFRRTHENPD